MVRVGERKSHRFLFAIHITISAFAQRNLRLIEFYTFLKENPLIKKKNSQVCDRFPIFINSIFKYFVWYFFPRTLFYLVFYNHSCTMPLPLNIHSSTQTHLHTNLLSSLLGILTVKLTFMFLSYCVHTLY